MTFTLPAHGGPNASERMGDLNGKPSISVADAAIQLDRAGFEWGGALGTAATVTYAFRADLPNPPAGVSGFTQFTPDQMAAAQLSLQAWSDVANITFVRQGTGTTGAAAYSDDAQILFGGATSLSSQESGVTFRPANPQGATVSVFLNDTETSASLQPGGFGAHTFTHEIGHAIGLSHPSYYNQTDSTAPTYASDALYAEDDAQYTDMSYFNATYTGAYLQNNRPQAPQMDDIAAAQRLYGANMATRTGDDVYGFHSNTDRPWYALGDASQTFAATIWDAGGHDTLDFSLYTQNQFLDLVSGDFSNVGGGVGNLAIYPGVIIEDAIAGSGDDVVRGNSVANVLQGMAGADTLIGGGGADTLFGNAGNDVLYPGAAVAGGALFTAAVTAYGGQGDDVIDARTTSASNLLSGDLGNDTIYSGAGFETVLGGGGDDSLVGGAAAGAGSLQLLFGNQGADTIGYAGGGGVEEFGGQDNDVLSIASPGQGQTRYLFGNLGDDTLSASGGYVSLFGGQGDDVVSVGADTVGHNYLAGDMGADTLTASAAGGDTLRGGQGADTLVVTAHGSGAGDLVVIGAGESTAAQGAGESNLDHIAGFNFASDHVAIAGHAAGSSSNVTVYMDGTANGSEAQAFAAAYLYAYGDGTGAHAAHVGATEYLAVSEGYGGTTAVYVFTADHVALAFTGVTASSFQTGAVLAG